MPGGSGATPVSALARTHRQNQENPPNDSTQIVWGLRGSCRVHKPGVPHGLASQQRLGPTDDVANNAQTPGLAQIPKQQARRAIQSPTGRPIQGGTTPASDSGLPLRPEGLTKEEQCSLLTLARLRTASSTGSPGQIPLLTLTAVSGRGRTEPLLIALLRLAW